MGYFRDELPGCEGHAVGFVTQDDCQADSGLYRELAYPRDRESRLFVEMVAAGCVCGWRSPRWRPAPGTRWMPFTVCTEKRDEDRVYQLWAKHADDSALEQRQGSPLTRGAPGPS